MGRVLAFVTPSGRKPDPVLRFTDVRCVPDGAFACTAVSNGRLLPEQVPAKGAAWEVVEEFALTYDGYAYWSDLVELAARVVQRWTRDGTLPDDLGMLRACLFHEARRSHHRGGEPHGRSARYVAELLDAIAAALPRPAIIDAAG
jgi:hypothetical protein